MPKYAIKLSLSDDTASNLVNDLNALAQIIFSTGGNVIALDVEQPIHLLVLLIEAEADTIGELFTTTALALEKIAGVFLLGQSFNDQDTSSLLQPADTFGHTSALHLCHNPKAIQIYPY